MPDMQPWRSVRHRVESWLIAGLLLLVVFLSIPIGMRADVDAFLRQSIDAVPQTEVALVLGASVVRGEPSAILAKRADLAIALYRARKVSKILVTGDNGALTHDEVTPVRNYLLAAGVPAADIFLDHAGFDTYSSMYRARSVFLVHSMTIVTQDFHLPRALWIARHSGIEAYGIPAEGGEGSLADYAREIPASLKAIVDIVAKREPRYLGPPISLSQDGESTWY
ncbi:MAG: hypothetical protein RLZZ416_243 [Candidatus Parcubacteria bacterium]|jgi:vancomycin permeability regulator SanA